MSQPVFSESDTLLLLLRKEERLLLRTKWLQSRCSEELLDPLGCECHIISPLNMRTDCRKVSVALAFSVFYNCFPNRVGELFLLELRNGSSSRAMLSGIPASLAFLNFCTQRATVARLQPTVFAIARCFTPCSQSALIFVRVTCRVVGPNGEA